MVSSTTTPATVTRAPATLIATSTDVTAPSTPPTTAPSKLASQMKAWSDPKTRPRTCSGVRSWASVSTPTEDATAVAPPTADSARVSHSTGTLNFTSNRTPAITEPQPIRVRAENRLPQVPTTSEPTMPATECVMVMTATTSTPSSSTSRIHGTYNGSSMVPPNVISPNTTNSTAIVRSWRTTRRPAVHSRQKCGSSGTPSGSAARVGVVIG